MYLRSQHGKSLSTSYLVFACFVATWSFLLLADAQVQFTERLFETVKLKYGPSSVKRVKDWEQLLSSQQSNDIDEKLYAVNRFFNQRKFVSDIEHWGREDYWATPIEFLGTNGGDCEDFTIAKYFSLRKLGVPSENLRLMYVKAIRLNQAHMVLAYYKSPDSVPLVLDNINPRILPASKRNDLLPIYSFNGDGLWQAKAQGRGRQLQAGGNNQLWNELLVRIEQGG